MRRQLLSSVLAGLILFLYAFAQPLFVAGKTVSLVFEIIPGVPLHPLQWTTAPPIREELAYPTPDDAPPATVIRPTGAGRHGAVIFFLGAAPDLDDPDFNRVASAIARAGVVVLVHRSPDMEAVKVSPRVTDGLVAAFQALARQPYIDSERVGFACFSVGASMCLLAAADPRIREQAALVNAFGGYSDVMETVAAAVTHEMTYDGLREPWTPQELAVDILRRGVINLLPSAQDREILQSLFKDTQPPGQGTLDMLTDDGRVVHAALTAGSRASFYDAARRLPADMQAHLAAVSPGAAIQDMHAKVYLMHDRADRFIPYVESRRLRDRLAPMTRVVHTELSIFRHVNPSGVEPSWDFISGAGRLFWHLYRVLLDLA